ncbi:MAG: hypothetical protein EBW87_04415 [Burkholderiaceae bacterium]|jgi:hypothetical protein|nr:hypothetical protein [Burkholderiaceae bacterium]
METSCGESDIQHKMELKESIKTQKEFIDKLEKLKETIDKIHIELLSTKHALFGVDGENGLRSRVNHLGSTVDGLKKFMWVTIGIGMVANFLGFVGIMYIVTGHGIR